MEFDKQLGLFFPNIEKAAQHPIQEASLPATPKLGQPSEESKEAQISEILPNDSVDATMTECIIICVDDNFVNLNSIRLMVEMMGYEGKIKCFYNSILAIDYLKDLCLTTPGKGPKVDLITVDSNLPIVNGITLVKEINKLLDENEEQIKKTN